LNKRLSNGIQLQTSYTWSKNFDNGSSHQDSYNPKADYAISTQDIHQRFVLSYLYQLPFGRGRRWASNASKWEDYLIGGWQLNGITTLQGGQPYRSSEQTAFPLITSQNYTLIPTSRTPHITSYEESPDSILQYCGLQSASSIYAGQRTRVLQQSSLSGRRQYRLLHLQRTQAD